MQSDQQLISQLGDAVEGTQQTLEEAKQRHKARITALRAEQRQEIEGIHAQVRGYEKALKAVTGSNGQREIQGRKGFRFGLRKESGAWGRCQQERAARAAFSQ